MISPDEEIARSKRLIRLQKEAFKREGVPSAGVRKDRIKRLKAMLIDNRDKISAAFQEDFGDVSEILPLYGEVLVSIEQIKRALKTERLWFKEERRASQPPFKFFGASSAVRYEPLGVIGNISPWNSPVQMSFGPVGEMFAAGNRAMIKPSEATPACAALIDELARSVFDESELAVITGDVDVSRAFAALPFDHIMFTGSTATGREIMRAAADNLASVTLELGGKCPVIISRSAPMPLTAERIMFMKSLNAGQICLSPDYLLVDETVLDSVLSALQGAAAKIFPTMASNNQYGSLLGARQLARMDDFVADARDKGAKIIEINPGNESFERTQKRPLTLVVTPPEGAKVLTEEIFGPILPVLTYSDLREALEYVGNDAAPLAVNYFGTDKQEETLVRERTRSGAFSVNAVGGHFLNNDLPFGGLGASGMGRYHGVDGFKAFSNARAVYRQTRVPIDRMIMPPWKPGFKRTIEGMLK